jgi:hypothetical protein
MVTGCKLKTVHLPPAGQAAVKISKETVRNVSPGISRHIDELLTSVLTAPAHRKHVFDRAAEPQNKSRRKPIYTGTIEPHAYLKSGLGAKLGP